MQNAGLYNHPHQRYLQVYFEFGQPVEGSAFGDVLARLMEIARSPTTEPRTFPDKPRRSDATPKDDVNRLTPPA
jgi:hypothetical protein